MPFTKQSNPIEGGTAPAVLTGAVPAVKEGWLFSGLRTLLGTNACVAVFLISSLFQSSEGHQNPLLGLLTLLST